MGEGKGWGAGGEGRRRQAWAAGRDRGKGWGRAGSCGPRGKHRSPVPGLGAWARWAGCPSRGFGELVPRPLLDPGGEASLDGAPSLPPSQRPPVNREGTSRLDVPSWIAEPSAATGPRARTGPLGRPATQGWSSGPSFRSRHRAQLPRRGAWSSACGGVRARALFSTGGPQTHKPPQKSDRLADPFGPLVQRLTGKLALHVKHVVFNDEAALLEGRGVQEKEKIFTLLLTYLSVRVFHQLLSFSAASQRFCFYSECKYYVCWGKISHAFISFSYMQKSHQKKTEKDVIFTSKGAPSATQSGGRGRGG